MQRISNSGKIQNTILTPDKVLNVLMYGSLHFDEIQYVGYRDVKTVIGKSVNRFPTGNRFSERKTGYRIYCTPRRHDPGNADRGV